MSLLTSSPFASPERRYSPSVPSPLNPHSCYEHPATTASQPKKPKRPAMSAVSPTQYLLRQKAIAAWHAEMLRKDLCSLVHGTAAFQHRAGPEGARNVTREALLASAVAPAAPTIPELSAWTDTRPRPGHAKAAGDVYLTFGLTFPSPFAPESAFPISWPCITVRRVFFLVGLVLGVLLINAMLGVVEKVPTSLVLSTATQEQQRQVVASMLTVRNNSSYGMGQIREAMPART
ncbi:hypothetical protein B0T22DRAFT_478606 [Podospora appendiculata]|uniref:Uncharacterized protein n=1 Tax=Podospora appendiculata TaxID=314037 RepID=A0AAE0X760_9PEZI|nr:hypothetical protein B0T22DRAFT_478606 [Podospora appendiculata]